MPRETEILLWKRIDVTGLECLSLSISDDIVSAESTVIGVEDGGFRLEHRWKLNSDWRALSLDVERWGQNGRKRLHLERIEGGWCVDGVRRADLDGTTEPDLSVTPFCNTFPIRAMTAKMQSIKLDTCYIDGTSMSVTRSRQRYDRLGPNLFRYVDLGLFAGFEAELLVDDQGLVRRYQHLFERITII